MAGYRLYPAKGSFKHLTRPFLAAVASLALLPAATSIAEAKRIALVLGVATYDNAPALKNPINDARAIAGLLREFDFQVFAGYDLGKRDIEQVMREFARKVEKGDVALIYFAGHGLQFEGRNYLLPKDANISRPSDLKIDGIEMDALQQLARGRAGTKLVLLDACRNNPFSRAIARSLGWRANSIPQGLARVDADMGTFIAYATKPGAEASDGDSAENSPFTSAFVRNARRAPELDIALLMRRVSADVLRETNGQQIPWIEGGLLDAFAFRTASLDVLKAKPVVAEQPVAPTPKAPAKAVASDAPATRAVEIDVTLGTLPNDGKRAWLGVKIRDLPADLARELGVEASASVLITEVVDGSAAQRAGVANGDIVLRMGSRGFSTSRSLAEFIGQHPPGTRLTLAVSRIGGGIDAIVRQIRALAESGNATAAFTLAELVETGSGVAKDKAEATRWYLKSAERGHAAGMRAVGRLHEQGDGLDKSMVEAARWYRKAADHGDSVGMRTLGQMYERGNGVEKNLTEAVHWYRKAAENNDVTGMRALGYMYDVGHGVAKSRTEAIHWYRKAADLGDATAMTNLGFLHASAPGAERNEAEAIRLYRMAAEKNQTRAMTNLGHMLANGRGVTRNETEAVDWYRKAAALNYGPATRLLGFMHEHGRGVQKDAGEAVRLYRKAAEQGDTQSLATLGHMYSAGRGVEQNATEAVSWFRKAAEKNHSGGMTALGYMYEHGRGVPKDAAEAVRWYRKGADHGNAQAMSNLGYMYANGRGTEKNFAEAAKWYRKGVEKGNSSAMANLAFLYENGQGVEQSSTNAAFWFLQSISAGNSFTVNHLSTRWKAHRLETRRALQVRLRDQGLYSGPIDGNLGPATQRALKQLHERAQSKS